MRMCVCIRKRPIFEKELKEGYFDCISTSNPQIRIHEPKKKVDGITDYIDTTDFKFDNVFGEKEDTGAIYESMVEPVIETLFCKGIVTCFAYGQTGSGKTFTMKGIQSSSINDMFTLAQTKYAEEQASFTVSFFEIYGGKLYDLLNNKKRLNVQEDYNNKIQIPGLKKVGVDGAEEMQKVIEYGNSVRVTHATQANDESSRSHAIC